jgi:hypothetical protein
LPETRDSGEWGVLSFLSLDVERGPEGREVGGVRRRGEESVGREGETKVPLKLKEEEEKIREGEVEK